MTTIEDRLKAAGHTLPEPAKPVASYVPFRIAGNMLFISGQVSMDENGVITGCLGKTMDLEAGMQAAERCGLMLLAQAKAACEGDLSRLGDCVKLGGFVACTPDFQDQPKVINGASDLMVTAMGDAGRHARAAVGVPALPLGAAVEVDAIFTLK